MSKELITIQLTHEECRGGDYVDPYNCPLAIALKKLGHKDVGISIDLIKIDGCLYESLLIDGEHRNNVTYISELIDKANNGETFSKTFKFQKI